MPSEQLITSVSAAVAAAPDDVALRLHLADLLAAAGRRDEAVQQAATVLAREPGNGRALALIAGRKVSTTDSAGPAPDPVPSEGRAGGVGPGGDEVLARLDAELADVVAPSFVTAPEPPPAGLGPVRFADVGGMAEVKARIEASVLAPLRNPELGRLYRRNLRGGLLLYGPPGCGKTFLARAVAGELGAAFVAVSLADVLDAFIGRSEQNVHELFEYARRSSPCVVFFDEVDAIGQKRSQRGPAATRGTINQLLTEMDGIGASNDGVFVLAATNQPWDVDVALRRPGRLDRMLLVLPPDEPAREAILRYHLRDRPVTDVDLRQLARRSEGYSGADLAYVCDVAAERALLDSARSGTVRMIEMADLTAALGEVKPSTGPWLETARNVVEFANEGGAYDELAAYLRGRRRR